MTSKALLSIIYELSQITPQRPIKKKEIFAGVAMKEEFPNETEIDLLLYNLENKGYITLTHSAKGGIIDVYLTEPGKCKAEGSRGKLSNRE